MSGSLTPDGGVEPERLEPFLPCIENYGVGDPAAEWPNNILSRRTVVYASGVIARAREPVTHTADSAELELCQRLAAEAKVIMQDQEVGMGSESGDTFHPFYQAADSAAPAPDLIDPALIRVAFGGTIFPLAPITVEPLIEAGVWWSEVTADCGDDDEADGALLQRWRELVAWFAARPEFRDTAFVRIGDSRALRQLDPATFPPGTELTGCVLPRLALGLTHAGSLAGIFGVSVQT